MSAVRFVPPEPHMLLITQDQYEALPEEVQKQIEVKSRSVSSTAEPPPALRCGR